MRNILAIPLSLFLIVPIFLFTGHSGAAEKVSVVAFFLLLGGIVWGLIKEGKGGMGSVGETRRKGLEKLVIFFGLAIPFILIFKAFFTSGPLAFGDAPFFNPENLKELFNLPLLWNFKDNNFGSTQYHILWLYLPTYLYGLLNHFLGLGNDILVRLIFYFPATILAIIGSWKFIGSFNQNIYGKFLGSVLYGFNTYFLMLLDGGQVGVALAYGLFPVASLSILSYVSNLRVKNFIFAVITLFILVSADIRIALLAVVFTILVGGVREVVEVGEIFKLIKRLSLLGLSVLGFSAFWVWPLISSFSLNNLGNLSGSSNFISLSSALFLFQPHFPLNDFGKIAVAPFYFALLPILIFGCLFFRKNENALKFSLLFLLLVFLAKGGSEPVGSFYSWLITLPGMVAFRDSSKFYMPLILTGGVLLSFTISSLEGIVRRKWVAGLVLVGVYTYLMVLIYPAILGNLSGVLGGVKGIREVGEDYQKIAQRLNKEDGFFRTLWFEEKLPLSYFNWRRPAISANSLHKERPFASMITGKYDLNNFLHSPQFPEWLKLLGIKYIYFPENERKKTWSIQEQKEREEFLTFVDNVPGIKRLDLQTSFLAYEVMGEISPQIFGVKKAYFIVGGEDLYQSLSKSPDFSLKGAGFIFLEEGKVNLEDLRNINPDSLNLVFYKKELKDLQMGYFIQDMVSPSFAAVNHWKTFKTSDYLTWKYELLKNGIDTKEFDFGKGVAISTIPGEKMKFNIPVTQPGNYFLAARFTSSLDGGLKIRNLGQEFNLRNGKPQSFKWELMGPMRMDGSSVDIEIVNEGNFALFNTLVLIPEDELRNAEQQAKQLTIRYKTIFWEGSRGSLESIGKENYMPVTYKQINPTHYQLTDLPNYPLWIVFSDHYHLGWDLEGSRQFPFYAMINGFYLERPQKNSMLYFTPQSEVLRGIFLSILSFGIISLVLIIIFIKRGGGRNGKNIN